VGEHPFDPGPMGPGPRPAARTEELRGRLRELKRHETRRCPKCGALTDRLGHCFVKGPPLIPQLDTDTPTEKVEVVLVSDLEAALESEESP
jgi:hypothetical protein